MAHLEKENEILQGRLTQPGSEEDGKVISHFKKYEQLLVQCYPIT